MTAEATTSVRLDRSQTDDGSAQAQATAPGLAAPISSTSEDFQRIMQQPMGQGNVITPRELYGDMNRTWRFAKALARGCGLGAGDEGAEIAMARIFIGAEMGIGPAASVRGIHFIKTRVALSADLMVAMAQDQGWEFEIQHSDPPGTWCEVTATHDKRKAYGFKWTMDMARKAGLVRGGSGWESYPYDMLYARAASHVARKVAPGRLMGLYTPEEARAIPVEDPDAEKGNGLADRLKNLPKNGNGHKTATVDADAHEQPPGDGNQLPTPREMTQEEYDRLAKEKAQANKPQPPANPVQSVPVSEPGISEAERQEIQCAELASSLGIPDGQYQNGFKRFLLAKRKKDKPELLSAVEWDELKSAIKSKAGHFAV